jgi:hypothetical protein
VYDVVNDSETVQAICVAVGLRIIISPDLKVLMMMLILFQWS